MQQNKQIITGIPDEIDIRQRWLVEYWAGELGVSIGRLEQCVSVIGNSAKRIRTYLKNGHRLAIEDKSGVVRLVCRITPLDDGFSIQCPYHPAKDGWLAKTPIDYSVFMGNGVVADHFAVSDTVKLSLHMTGFVQFSTAGKSKIISGFCETLQQPKGLGLKAPGNVNVSTGPLCGIVVQGLEEFTIRQNEKAEIFGRSDLWFHPEFPADDGTYHFELFMLTREEAAAAKAVNGKRTLEKLLPFMGKFKFPHTLRIVEIPHLWFSLGIIVSPSLVDSAIKSGYKLASPSVRESDGQMIAITAWYPRPSIVEGESLKSLDYPPNHVTSESGT